MRSKIKGFLSIIIMSLTFFLAADTKYVPALGDPILEFIGLRSWSNDNSGTHLTVTYFGVLFLISLILVRRYAIERLAMKRKRIFIIFVVLVTSYTFITGITAQHIKRTSDGLLAIAYNSENSKLNYESKDYEVVNLEATFTLENYGNQNMKFFISIDNPWFRKDKLDKIVILNSDGTRASFVLQAGETKTFNITPEKYTISGGITSLNGSSRGGISEIVLSNKEGEVVKLTSNNFFGMNLAK